MGLGAVGLPDVGVGEVAGHQRAALVGDFRRNRQGVAVERLQQRLLADDAQLLAMAVVGEGLDHVGAGVDEIAVQLAHQIGMLEHDFGHEGAGLQIAAPLELEEIAFGADDRPRGEAVYQSR